ncbi:MAG: VOC family protein [Oligoflexales bacterium]
MLFDAVGVVCEDIKKSLVFYKNLELDFKSFGEGDHYEATTSSGVRIMLDSAELIKSLQPDWVKPEKSGVSLCFRFGSPSEVDQVYLKISTMGLGGVREPWDAPWGQRYASIYDPDGYQIDLFAELTM